MKWSGWNSAQGIEELNGEILELAKWRMGWVPEEATYGEYKEIYISRYRYIQGDRDIYKDIHIWKKWRNKELTVMLMSISEKYWHKLSDYKSTEDESRWVLASMDLSAMYSPRPFSFPTTTNQQAHTWRKRCHVSWHQKEFWHCLRWHSCV